MSHNLIPPADQNDRELDHLYRLQVRQLQDLALFLLSPEGQVKTWNRGVQKTFGYSESEWVGQDTSIIFVEEDRTAGVPFQELQAAAKEGRAVDVRWHVRKDGTRIYLTVCCKLCGMRGVP